MMRVARLERSVKSVLLGAAAALPAMALLFPHISYVPMWDGGDYLARLRYAALSDFRPVNYFLSAHPTFLYALLMSVPVRHFPDSIEALSYLSILLYALSVAAVREIAARIRPGAEATLLALCYALCPALLANVLHFTPDLGVAIFFPIYMASLSAGPGPPSALTGAMLANTKELGLVLYAASIPVYLLSFGWKRTGWRRLGYLVLPAIATAGIYVLFDGPPHRRDFSETVEISPLNVFYGDKTWRFLADAFVLSFSWVPAGVILIAGYPALSRSKRPIAAFLALMLLSSSYATTRVPTWNNTRYMLPAYCLVFLLAYLCLPEVLRRGRSRAFALIAFALLLAPSSFYSLDPVSSRVFWTLKIGEREIWGLQRRESRDQLVYNLQYINLHYLFGDLLEHVRPDSETVFAGPPGSSFYDLTFMDPTTFQRSFGKPGDIPLRMVESHREEELSGAEAPRVLHYVMFPTLDSAGGARSLRRLGYRETERRAFARDGYSLGYARFERNE